MILRKQSSVGVFGFRVSADVMPAGTGVDASVDVNRADKCRRMTRSRATVDGSELLLKRRSKRSKLKCAGR